MKDKRSIAAPIAIAVLLLLPLLYVGSYCAIVRRDAFIDADHTLRYYRFGRDRSRAVFWPLETLDRRIQPEAWYDPQRQVE
jgi:hypothetical protein